MTERELAAAIGAAKARLAELADIIAPLKARLFAATTHTETATVDDYTRGWAQAAAVRDVLDPLLDEERSLRHHKAACMAKIEHLRWYGAHMARKGVPSGEKIVGAM